MTKIVSLLFIFLGLYSHAQNKSIVCDSLNKTPVAFATYMYSGSNTDAYMTDVNGVMVINKLQSDKMILSCIGYATKTISLKTLPDTIFLNRKNIELDEVVVTKYVSKKTYTQIGYHDEKPRTFKVPFGNFAKSGGKIERAFFAVYIPNKDSLNGIVSKLNFRVRKESNKETCYIRPYIYTIENGQAVHELLNENIVIEVSKKKEILTIDVEDRNIIFPDNGFFLCLEMLENTDSVIIGVTESNKTNSYHIIKKKEREQLISVLLSGMEDDEDPNVKYNFQMGITVKH
jgi:hypothetical protein